MAEPRKRAGQTHQNLEAKMKEMIAVEVERNGTMMPSPASSDGSHRLIAPGTTGIRGGQTGTSAEWALDVKLTT
jgi:hypothetical protein